MNLPEWEPGELVQIKRGVYGRGEVGVVVGQAPAHYGGGELWLLTVLFSDGTREVHPSNLQKPDGRLKPRKPW